MRIINKFISIFVTINHKRSKYYPISLYVVYWETTAWENWGPCINGETTRVRSVTKVGNTRPDPMTNEIKPCVHSTLTPGNYFVILYTLI